MREYKKFKKVDMKRFKDNILKTSGLPTHYLSDLTVDEYLNICQICYKAIYYSDYTKNKTPLQLYLDSHYLGCKIYGIKELKDIENKAGIVPLLRLENNKPKKFKKFIKKGWGIPFHDYEIIFGRIYLACDTCKDGIFINLYECNSRDEEAHRLAILIYNDLIKNNIPVLFAGNNMED
ncbi:MAG: hypothetical protein J6A59_14040 [Lachnospiraceae bacterium]|nr:hypothetical protein [Lachnospiraceae bacterium]